MVRNHNDVTGFVSNIVDANCCSFWTNGCGLNPLFSSCATVLESVTPLVEQLGNCIWIFGSPLAFPFVFCFSPLPHTKESSGYEIAMCEAPCKRPITCCFATICCPCAQWYTRRVVLHNDMTKYKLWQGYHDGPQCCARSCPNAPITIKSGTYGEQDCPNAFLCLEVCCLGGLYSVCCAFDVSRRYQRDERGLSLDPTEQRQHKCIHCFSQIMHACMQLGCCFCATSCLVKVCATDSADAQQCAGECGRAARACCRIAHILWKGIIWTRVIGMGCMTTQMIAEAKVPYDKATQGPKQKPQFQIHEAPPKNESMKDRGGAMFDESQPVHNNNHNNNSNDEPDPTTVTELTDLLMPWEKSNDHNKENMTTTAPNNNNISTTPGTPVNNNTNNTKEHDYHPSS